MSTMTVRELIKHLITYDMEEPVYIGLGPDVEPNGAAQIYRVSPVNPGKDVPCGYGVYLVPFEHIQDADKEHGGDERKDAERYRFACKNGIIMLTHEDGSGFSDSCVGKKEADAKIDRALVEKGERHE